MNLLFKPKYFILAFLILILEVYIAIYVHDQFIRPYVGDFLVVILLYCLLKSFWNQSSRSIAVIVLLFSIGVEVAQYFNIVNLLGLPNNKIARVVIGTSFHWKDIVAYLLALYLRIG